MTDDAPPVSVVIPNWNGRAWLPDCLRALAAQDRPEVEVIVVDNGSDDGSLEYLGSGHPDITVLALHRNAGFAHAANLGIDAARSELVALVNTDVVLASDWLRRMADVLASDPGAASVACKMLALDDRGRVYDAGDILRRDGACEQRGRFERDDGRWDSPGEVFGACAGAALYRRAAWRAVGGFDERYFAYLEDVDLALRLGLAGWRCRYEPVVALHAGEGSSRLLARGHQYFVPRNTLLLIAKAFPVRWLPLVAYRQASWARAAARERRLTAHLRGLAAGLLLVPRGLGERRRLLSEARVSIEAVVPRRPIRGPSAGGYRPPAAHETTAAIR
jgi:GT2 family glycosyltransferase